MQKLKLIVDSPSDIPDEDLQRYDIDMLSVPIVVNGREYLERQSFSLVGFYEKLVAAKELPTTSRIPQGEYVARYHKAWQEGYKHIISVTINAGGSGIYESSCMAVESFFHQYPEAKGQISIHVVDSRTYSLGYGYPVIQGAKMAEEGRPVEEILEYLEDYFDRLEIYLACYTLEYAKKSGRITAAAAVVGDVLGLRPIISMIDGQTRTVEKVRGDKQVAPRLVEHYLRQREDPQSPVVTISAAVEEYGQQLTQLLEEATGGPVPHYKAGASIVINAGPNIAAVCLLGKKRGRK